MHRLSAMCFGWAFPALLFQCVAAVYCTVLSSNAGEAFVGETRDRRTVSTDVKFD